jgi:malonyl-CoA O-methyltransferase
VSALTAREGYRLWAPTYDAETAISALEDHIVAELGVTTAGARLLDVGCGTGRRLRDAGDATLAVGVDLTPPMLAQATRGTALAAADARALPFPSATFDVVWCRLVIGHVADAAAAYAELARVCRPGGVAIVTDFHPDAAAAGHQRTFRDASGAVHAIEHHVHAPERQVEVARAAGLACEARRDGEVGPTIRAHYAAAGKLAMYDAQRGLRLVLAIRFRRVA